MSVDLTRMKNLFYKISRICLSVEEDIFFSFKILSVFQSKNISILFIESGCNNVFQYSNAFCLLYLRSFNFECILEYRISREKEML